MISQVNRSGHFFSSLQFLLIVLLISGTDSASAAITYVQNNYVNPSTAQTSVSVAYSSPQTAGNLNIVIVAWWNTAGTAHVSSVTDSKGNTYSLAVGPTVDPTAKEAQAIYYAKNIQAAAAGANTVSVAFDASATTIDVRVAEYSGLDKYTPFDVGTGAYGTAATADSGSVVTTYANDLLIGANVIDNDTGVGTGYTLRLKTTPNGDLLEDKTVTSAGSNNATAAIFGGGAWVMQIAAFRASDVQAPTAPSGLGAAAASSSQINLSWTASTDNIAVTNYLIERCQGAACSTFSQIANIAATTTYSSTGLSASTSYSYRIRAVDANGNTSGYSSTATATTSSSSDTQSPTVPSSFTAVAASSSQINLSWAASTDNVAVSGYDIERCQGAGCSSFAALTSVTSTTYSDTGLAGATSYSYRIRAKDAIPNYSGYSTTATATTPAAPDTQPPTAPTALTATVASNQVSLTWGASSDNVGVTAYLVERCTGAGCSSFTQIASVGTTSFLDTTADGLTTYNYRVRAQDAVPNYSAYSAVVSPTTEACD